MSRDPCAGHADGFVGLGHWKHLHELNSRREVGIIVRHSKVPSGLVDTFEADWSAKETIESAATLQAARHALKRNLKANMKKLSPLDPLVREALREVVSKTDGSATLTTREMKDTVEKAVREAVRERVQEMLSESGGEQ